MLLEEILIDENLNIKAAIERLEKVRCKVVYVVRAGKLIASVSDGDVRRYTLRNGDVNASMEHIANYSPKYLLRYEKEELERIFSQSDQYSMPVVNYNHEVVEVVFRDGRRIKRKYSLNCPVVIMAGGRGTRLYPYTKILPKALIPIGEIPISERIIDNFIDYGCTQFFMVVNHKKNMIQAYFDGTAKKYDIAYIEEERPLGTGGGLYLLEGQIEQDFFLVNCDIIIDANYNEIYTFHKAKENYITIVAAKYRHTVPYGVIGCDDENMYQGISEKPDLHYLINTGMYVVNSELLRKMPHNQEISFPDLINAAKQNGRKIGVYVVEESAYMDMGQMEELEKMKDKLNV